VTEVVALVKPDNAPSLRAFEAAGFREVERSAERVVLSRGAG
jgi:RimJ/RimL family protein N-acetyltransferase